MKSKLINGLLLLVFLIGIIGAGLLVYEEIKTTEVCPKLLGIPACYFILTCFVIPFFTHIFKGSNIIYFLFSGLAFVIGLVASFMQFTGLGECPKTANGTPMCYYSLMLFTSIVFLKIILLKNKKSSQ